MPLINFRTDLTSLQYGKDRPGGGSSGQPYIQFQNPGNTNVTATDPVSLLFNTYYRANTQTLDFPARGGAIVQIGSGGVPSTPAGSIDRMRIKAFLNDPVRGKIFLLKQQGLQFSNPNIQVPTTLGIPQLSLGTEVVENTRVFNMKGEGITFQTAVQGTGIHYQRHGLTPRLVNPFQQTYEYYVTRNNTADSNRLTVLTALKLLGLNSTLLQSVQNSQNPGGTARQDRNLIELINRSNVYGISSLNTQILNYTGGPGSVYGVGFTIINRAVDTTQANERGVLLNNAITFTYNQIADQATRSNAKWFPKVQDFRKQLPGVAADPDNYNSTTRWYNPALRGDPGRVPSNQRISYSTKTTLGTDAINAQGLFVYNEGTPPWTQDGVNTKDIIKFTFECMSNDYPDEVVAIVFRAFLTGISDNHQAELNSFKYLGRGENFRTYQGFDRSIGFSFKIAAQSRQEMVPLYTKLNHLITQVYPDYSTKTGLMRGSVVKLTIGDYFYRIPGFLESVNVTMDDNYPWEIALDADGVDNDMNQVPQILNVQCSFKPIHDFLPRRATAQDQFVPLIGQHEQGKGWLQQPVVPIGALASQAAAKEAIRSVAPTLPTDAQLEAERLQFEQESLATLNRQGVQGEPTLLAF